MTRPNEPPPSSPPPIDYHRPGAPPPRPPRASWGGFCAGAALGTGLSAIVWPASWNALDQSGAGGTIGPILMIGLPLAKLIGGITALALGRRGFGIGLLVSIALGFFIFFWVCAANFKI